MKGLSLQKQFRKHGCIPWLFPPVYIRLHWNVRMTASCSVSDKISSKWFFQRGRWGTLLKITWISLLHTIRYFIPANASSCNIFLSCVYFYLSEVWKEFSCHDVIISDYIEAALRWRRNEHDGISNHQPLDCLVNCLFRRKSKKTSKLRVTSFCVRNSLVTGEFPAQRASNAENVSIWWRHHGVIFEKQIKSHMHLNRFIFINISIKINKYGICTF